MGRSRIWGSSTEYGGSECDREASMMMRPNWGFAPRKKKRKLYGLSYPRVDFCDTESPYRARPKYWPNGLPCVYSADIKVTVTICK